MLDSGFGFGCASASLPAIPEYDIDTCTDAVECPSVCLLTTTTVQDDRDLLVFCLTLTTLSVAPTNQRESALHAARFPQQ